MNKLVFGLLGALALGASALPSVAAPSALGDVNAPSNHAPLTPAVFHADGTDAHVSTVQYRREEMHRAPPPRHHRRHYRHHRRPHLFRGH